MTKYKLSEAAFKKGLEELEIAFEGFGMYPAKVKLWYRYCKDIADEDWLKKIANCIRGCSRIPTLADIIDWRGYHINQKEEENLRIKREEIDWESKKEKRDEDDYKYTDRPEEITKVLYTILGEIDSKYKDKYKDKLKKLKESEVEK